MSHAVEEITNTAQKHGTRAAELVYAGTLFAELGAQLEKYGQHEAQEQVKAAYVRELSEKSRLEASKNALRVIVQQMVGGGLGDATADSIVDMYRDKVKEIHVAQSKRLERGEEMQEYMRVVSPDSPFMLMGDDDVAVMASASDDNLICPITRSELVEPVRNTCGHIYSKAPIEAMIRSRNRVACPVAGCSQYVSSRSLAPDAATQRKLDAQKKKRKRSDDADDVEDL